MYQVIDDVKVWGSPVDERAVAQAVRCLRSDEEAVAAALMADHHVGYSQPIGGVIAYVDAVTPSGVGYDIGCGNNAVLTDIRWEDIRDDIETIMDTVADRVSFGIGSKSNNRDHAIFDDSRWGVYREIGEHEYAAMLKLAREQLGSVGSGNHYVDIFEDEQGRIWVGNHFGSRGFGHRTATGFLNLAKGRRFSDKGVGESMDQPPTTLRLDQDLGRLYWDAMGLAGEYARVGRDLVLQQVLDILGAKGVTWIRNNHNLAWKEMHEIDGRSVEVIVVRKGATPAFPGQLGFVGGSMGDDAVIVRGVDTQEARDALRSTVHGAGRVMSRTQAAGKMNWKTRTRSGGQVTREMMLSWLAAKGVSLRGGGTDESPQAYKRLDQVLKAHEDSIEVVHRLRPVGVAMAGEGESDPYKD
jgi:tRNA-splicing ligase RtcB (3'-phosphate/5'-hydroxy nucleic acid ligase)